MRVPAAVRAGTLSDKGSPPTAGLTGSGHLGEHREGTPNPLEMPAPCRVDTSGLFAWEKWSAGSLPPGLYPWEPQTPGIRNQLPGVPKLWNPLEGTLQSARGGWGELWQLAWVWPVAEAPGDSTRQPGRDPWVRPARTHRKGRPRLSMGSMLPDGEGGVVSPHV